MKRLYIHKLIKLMKYLVLTGLIGYYFFDRKPNFLKDVDEKEEDGGKLVERKLVERELVNTKVKNRDAVINHPSMIYSEFKETINILSETQEPDVLGQVPANIHDQHKIIIVTEWRSGSSFLGDIFNMHPDVFYNCQIQGAKFQTPNFIKKTILYHFPDVCLSIVLIVRASTHVTSAHYSEITPIFKITYFAFLF